MHGSFSRCHASVNISFTTLYILCSEEYCTITPQVLIPWNCLFHVHAIPEAYIN